MTANLWNTNVDSNGFTETVTRLAPDVLCVQELDPLTSVALNSMYPYGDLRPRDDAFGMGIALTAPAKLSQLDLSLKVGQVAILDPQDWPMLSAPMQLINLHLAAPAPGEFFYSLRHRRLQLKQLQSFLDNDEHEGPRVLAGDLNSTPIWPLYRRLIRDFDDLHRDAARRQRRKPKRTWGPTSRWPRLLRIDHALGIGVHACDAWVVPIPGSDHSALVLDIETA